MLIKEHDKQRVIDIPGMRPLFFNQKMAQNDPEKKIPSQQAIPTSLTAKDSELVIHFFAQFAFFSTQGIVATAFKSFFFSLTSFIRTSMSMPYVSVCICSIACWKI